MSGLTAETRAHVENVYVQANHAKTLKVMDDREEALAVVGSVVEMAVMKSAPVSNGAYAFDGWLASVDGTKTVRAA